MANEIKGKKYLVYPKDKAKKIVSWVAAKAVKARRKLEDLKLEKEEKNAERW